MAMIDVGGGGGRRALNRELTLVPFIDFLLCIVAFLLVTAVWSRLPGLDVKTDAPGVAAATSDETPRPALHVDITRADRFVVEWRHGGKVFHHGEVPRKEAPLDGELAFPALAQEVERAWKAQGLHRHETDPMRDRAVLHTSNAASFEEVTAAIDAIRATRRPARHDKATAAFDVVFAAD